MNPILIGLKLLSSLDRDGYVFDIQTNTMLSKNELYDKYFATLSSKDIVDAIADSVATKWKVIEEEDRKKKELAQKLILQPSVNEDGSKNIYVTPETAPEIIKQFMTDDEVVGKIPDDHEWNEGVLCYRNNTYYYTVNKLVEPFDFDRWKGERNGSQAEEGK